MGLFILTALIGVAVLLPLIYLVVRAFGSDTFAYLASPRAWTVIANSVLLVLAVMLGAAVIGVPFAWLTARTDLLFRRVWLILGLVTMVMPTFLTAVTYTIVLSPRGMLQNALEPLGVERLPSIYGFFGAWMVLTLCTFPYVVMPVRAALLHTTPILEDAAQSLGADRWRVFWHVIFPSCRRALISGMMLTGLYTLSDFGAMMIMRYDGFSRVIYLQYTNSFDRSGGAALSLVLLVLTLGMAGIKRIAGGKGFADSDRVVRIPTPIPLRRWRIPALMFCGAVVGIGTLIPFGVMVYWLTQRAITRRLEFDLVEVTLNTLSVSGVTALVVALVSLPLALIAYRSTFPFHRWLAQLPYLTYVLPGIVVGLSLVFFTARYLTGIYQTMPVLIFAYTLRFLSISVDTTQNAFTQINRRMEDAAQSLGASAGQVVRHIIVPLSRSGILAGMVLVFLATMKELPITLLLTPTGFDTFSYRIWSAYQESIYSQIAPLGLALMISSALALGVMLRNNVER